MSTLPAEVPYSNIELDLIDNEPPGLFPVGQDSYWGQVRKVFADYLQHQIMDLLDAWYNNLDPRTCDANDIAMWESMLGLSSNTSLPLDDRRAAVQARMTYGAFTRTARQDVVETFLTATFGPATEFTPTGIPFDAAGISMYSGVTSLAGLYSISEDITNFAYTVTIDNSVNVDTSALTRALQRITPAGINFSIVHGTPPPTRTMGAGTYGSGSYGGT